MKKSYSTTTQPSIDVALAKLHTAGLAMVGKTSFSGVQKKLSLGLSADRSTLQVVSQDAHFILKPQSGTYPQLPENEHVTMRLAAMFGLNIPPCGLLRLRDQSVAYTVKRFDRPRPGVKQAQEDFCQLTEKPAIDKYNGSAELCVRVLRKYSTEPTIDVAELYQQCLFSWWVGNGDLHLKNFSLTTSASGSVKLTPAYDLLSTAIYIPDDDLALPMGGKRSRVSKKEWLEFADDAKLPVQAAKKMLAQPHAMMSKARDLIAKSYLSGEMAQSYQRILAQRALLLR